MEIGDKCVNRLEFIAGIDENRGLGIHGMKLAVGCGGRLKNSAGGGADRNNSTACGTSAIDLISHLGGDVEVLAVHLVLLDLIHLYGTEGAKAHVEGYLTVANALLTDFLKQLVGKVQTCGGSGGRALLLCVNGLIILFIFKLFRNIRRQRHIADGIENLVDILILLAVVLKSYGTVTAVYDRGNGGAKNSTKIKACANLRALAGANQGLPLAVFQHTKEQKLHITAGLIGLTEKSCRDNLGGVNNKHILGVKIIDYIAEDLMLNIALVVKNHKAAAVALVGG